MLKLIECVSLLVNVRSSLAVMCGVLLFRCLSVVLSSGVVSVLCSCRVVSCVRLRSSLSVSSSPLSSLVTLFHVPSSCHRDLISSFHHFVIFDHFVILSFFIIASSISHHVISSSSVCCLFVGSLFLCFPSLPLPSTVLALPYTVLLLFSLMYGPLFLVMHFLNFVAP